MINYSKKNGRFFVSCNAYPDCTNTYTLPPNGQIKKTEKTCEKCNYPMLMRLSKGKKPWIFCWNPQCPTNSDWVKRRDENAENLKKNEEKMTEIKPSLYDFTQKEIMQLIKPSFRVKQIYGWLYHQYAQSFDDMKNITKTLKEELADKYVVNPLTIVNKEE